MRKYLWFFIVAVLTVAVLAGGFFAWKYYQNKKAANQKTPDAVAIQSNPSVPVTPTPAAVSSPAPTLVYPMTDFVARASTNLFGTYYAPGSSSHPDRTVCPNATYYPGYHTAIDLETTAAEASQKIPVFAIASGTVKQVSVVTGYGGLIIIQYNLGGADYTAYYGHIDLSTVKTKKGEPVTVGETLASLGDACLASNGNVRKHMHFGLHKGTSVVVSGYVASKSELSNWVDPKELLSSLGAKQ